MAISAFVGAVLDVVEASLRHPRGRDVDRNNSPSDLLARLALNHGFGDLVTNDANARFEKVLGNLLRLEFRPGQCALPLLFGDRSAAQPRKAAPDLAYIDDIHGNIVQGDVCIDLLHGQHDIIDRTMRDLPRRDCGLEFERMALEARCIHGDRLETLAAGIRNVAAATLERLASLRPANAGLQMLLVRKFQIRSLDELWLIDLRDTRHVVAVRPPPQRQLERRGGYRGVGRRWQGR